MKCMPTTRTFFCLTVAYAFVLRGVQAQTSLANDWVVTRTNVSAAANLPTDLHLMMFSLASGDRDTALSIYSGSSSNSSAGLNHASTYQSLQSMSRLTQTFEGQSFYNLHLFGLAGGLLNLTKDYKTFGDDFVIEQFEKYNRSSSRDHATMPAEAALVLVLYPFLVSTTLSAVSYCERYGKQDPSEELVSSLEKSILSFDQAMAYYVGNDQVIGSATTGYSFYSLSERAHSHFSISSGNFVLMYSGANQHIRTLFQEAYKYYSFPDACVAGSQTAALLQGVVHRFITQTQISLVQMLIHSMATKDLIRTKMYATAIIPQLVRCKPSAYRALKESLLDKPYDPQNLLSIVEELQQTYSCLGFTCQDIGVYDNSGMLLGQCPDRLKNIPIVGYDTSTDVYEISKIDLDILEIKCYLSLNLFDAASQIYQYGHNSRTSEPDDLIVQYRTLQSMAKSTDRAIAKPYYDVFESYNNDPDYANTAIRDALLERGRFADASRDQRAEIIVGTLSYQVMYMFALSQSATAILKCQMGDLPNALHYWDSFAAGLVGSLEGPQLGGSKKNNDGVLLYALANSVADPMGRTNEDYYALINSRIVDALWSGKGLLTTGQCGTAQHVADELFQFTLVPIMQAIIVYAHILSTSKAPFSNTDGKLGAAESVTRAILPVVCNYSQEDCETLAMNMLMHDGFKPVGNGTSIVVNALNNAILVQSPYKNILCQDIGGWQGVDNCAYVNAIQRQSSQSNALALKNQRLGCLASIAVAIAIVA